MAVRAHNLIWVTEQQGLLPKFVLDEQNASVLEANMLAYISKTVSHIGERAFCWDVINEAISDDPNQETKPSPWDKIDDYIYKAFVAAHEANPKAVLFYNDYNAESAAGWSKTKSDKVYNLVKGLLDRGCPVHGVGLQAHIEVSYSDEMLKGIRENIQRLHDLGLVVHITELDIKCNSQRKCTDSDWTEQLLEQQADLYAKLL